MARRRVAARPRWRPASLTGAVLMVLLAAVVSVTGYYALRFVVSCTTLDGARAAIEAHIKGRQVQRMARVLKTADRELLAARTLVQVTALTCGPSLLGGVTCQARYVVNGQTATLPAIDHYFRIGHSLLTGWQEPSVRETSGLRYSLAPCRCSLDADGR